jgi:hypothetical protein
MTRNGRFETFRRRSKFVGKQTSSLFKYFVGAQHDRAWNYDAERHDGLDLATRWRTPEQRRFTG